VKIHLFEGKLVLNLFNTFPRANEGRMGSDGIAPKVNTQRESASEKLKKSA